MDVLHHLLPSGLVECVDSVPNETMSPTAKDFATQLRANRLQVLQNLKP